MFNRHNFKNNHVFECIYLYVDSTWVHLKRLIVSPTTKTVVHDKVCHRRQSLCFGQQQSLSSTTDFVFGDNICLLAILSKKTKSVVGDSLCHRATKFVFL